LHANSSKNPRSGMPYFNNKIYHPATTDFYANTISSSTPNGYGPCGDANLTDTNTTGYFMVNPCGTVGNSNRRFFPGPGIDNYNMSLLKNTKITEGSSLQFRFEAFNVFNHAQFNNPAANAKSASTFGTITTALDPRIMQAALKFEF
jgi:hypothetical protein